MHFEFLAQNYLVKRAARAGKEGRCLPNAAKSELYARQSDAGTVDLFLLKMLPVCIADFFGEAVGRKYQDIRYVTFGKRLSPVDLQVKRANRTMFFAPVQDEIT